MKEFTSELENYLNHKNFSDLSEQEKSYVLCHLSEEEYISTRKVIAESKNLYLDISPKDTIREDLVRVLKSKKAKDNFLVKVLTYPVPVWQMGVAASLLFLFLFNFLRHPQHVNVNSMEEVKNNGSKMPPSHEIVHSDLEEKNYKIEDKQIRVKTENTLAQVDHPLESELVFNLANEENRVGSSLKDDTLLKKFFIKL